MDQSKLPLRQVAASRPPRGQGLARSPLAALLPLVLGACSGGGGGGPVNIPRTPETVVFLTSDAQRLLALADDGSSAAPMDLASPPMTQISSFALAPDGQAVAYIADGDSADQYHLYVSAVGASAPARVSQLTSSTSDVYDFAWAPDSQSLAYRADGLVDDRADLYRVNRDGSGHYRVFETGVSSIFISASYAWSPDSRYLAFSWNQGAGDFALHQHDSTNPVEGADSVLFAPVGRDIRDVLYSPDSQWIAMRTDFSASDDEYEVYRGPTDLSTALVRSNGSTGGVSQIAEYSWSPDSRRLAQRVTSFPGDSPEGINIFELATETSTRIITSSTLGKMAWSPAGNDLAVAAAFVPGAGAAGEAHLLTYDADQDLLRTVSDSFVGSESLRTDFFAWSPSGARIAYGTRISTLNEKLYLADPSAATVAVEVLGIQGIEGYGLEWSPSGQRLALLELNQNSAFHPGEWHIISQAGQLLWSSGEVFTFGSSRSMAWSNDGARAVYSRHFDDVGPDRIASVGAGGAGDRELSPLPVRTFPNFAVSATPLP